MKHPKWTCFLHIFLVVIFHWTMLWKGSESQVRDVYTPRMTPGSPISNVEQCLSKSLWSPRFQVCRYFSPLSNWKMIQFDWLFNHQLVILGTVACLSTYLRLQGFALDDAAAWGDHCQQVTSGVQQWINPSAVEVDMLIHPIIYPRLKIPSQRWFSVINCRISEPSTVSPWRFF